jgi:hypothetical protein
MIRLPRSTQPTGRERVQHVDDDGDRDGRDDQSDRDQGGNFGGGEHGEEPDDAAGDEQRAHAVGGAPPPGEQASGRIDPSDDGVEEGGPRRRGVVGEQHQLDRAEEPDGHRQLDEGERRRPRGHDWARPPGVRDRDRSLHLVVALARRRGSRQGYPQVEGRR